MIFDKAVGKSLQINKVNVTGNLRKEDPCHVVAETLATLFHSVT